MYNDTMHIERPRSHSPIPPHAQKVFGGKIFDTYQWEQELFDGTTTTFEKLKRPDTAVVFPILPDGRILLIEQEQPNDTGFYMSTPGGRIDEGEDPLAAAKRELLEETGYEAEHWTLWDAWQPTHKIDWAVYAFVAKGLKKISDLHLDAGERIRMMPVTFDDFLENGVDRRYVGAEILLKLAQARLSPEKHAGLRTLFDPNL